MTSDNSTRKDIGEDLNYQAIWEIGIVFALCCIVITIYLYGLYLRVDHAENYRKQIASQDTAVIEKELSQIHEINTFGWINQEQGLVAIPIDLAMQKTAQKLSVDRFVTTREQALEPEAESGSGVEDGETN